MSEADQPEPKKTILGNNEIKSFEEWLGSQSYLSRSEGVRRRAYSMFIETDPMQLRRGASDEDTTVRMAVATNEMTPTDIMTRFVDADECLLELANNPGVPAELQSRLAHHANAMVRLTLASNPALLAAVIQRLASDECDLVRREVVMNPATPSSTVDALAQDSHGIVRKEVARRTASMALLGRFATDEDYTVRLAVASNPHTSFTILENLAADPAPCVRESVMRHSNSTDHIKTIAVLAGGT